MSAYWFVFMYGSVVYSIGVLYLNFVHAVFVDVLCCSEGEHWFY